MYCSQAGSHLFLLQQEERMKEIITENKQKREKRLILQVRGTEIDCSTRPLVMGIVNLSVDSFSGDGLPQTSQALQYAQKIVTQGADIVDIGGESARTNRAPIEEEEEIRRIIPFVEGFCSTVANMKSSAPLLSINTWRPNVARTILNFGGHILNDMSGLLTSENASICAETGAALVIMHSRGEPKIAHKHIHYSNIMDALQFFFGKNSLSRTARC